MTELKKRVMGVKVPMVLIDNGFALNVCPFRTVFNIGLDVETIIPSPLTVRAYDKPQGKLWVLSKLFARLA